MPRRSAGCKMKELTLKEALYGKVVNRLGTTLERMNVHCLPRPVQAWQLSCDSTRVATSTFMTLGPRNHWKLGKLHSLDMDVETKATTSWTQFTKTTTIPTRRSPLQLLIQDGVRFFNHHC